MTNSASLKKKKKKKRIHSEDEGHLLFVTLLYNLED